MFEVSAHLWPWLAACLGVGAATGALAPAPAAPGRKQGLARWLIWALLAFAAGVVAAALGALEGTQASRLESALACFAAFLLGAGAAALLFRQSLAGHERWALGLLPAALLWWGAAHVAPVAPPAVTSAAEAPLASAPEKRPDMTGAIPEPAVAPKSPPDAVLPLTGALDAGQCRRALAAADPVEFRPGRSTIHRRAALALDKVVEVIRRCPEGTIEIYARGDGGAIDAALARRRALAAERYLRREGVGGRNVVVAADCCEGAKNATGSGAIDYMLR